MESVARCRSPGQVLVPRLVREHREQCKYRSSLLELRGPEEVSCIRAIHRTHDAVLVGVEPVNRIEDFREIRARELKLVGRGIEARVTQRPSPLRESRLLRGIEIECDRELVEILFEIVSAVRGVPDPGLHEPDERVALLLPLVAQILKRDVRERFALEGRRDERSSFCMCGSRDTCVGESDGLLACRIFAGQGCGHQGEARAPALAQLPLELGYRWANRRGRRRRSSGECICGPATAKERQVASQGGNQEDREQDDEPVRPHARIVPLVVPREPASLKCSLGESWPRILARAPSVASLAAQSNAAIAILTARLAESRADLDASVVREKLSQHDEPAIVGGQTDRTS